MVKSKTTHTSSKSLYSVYYFSVGIAVLCRWINLRYTVRLSFEMYQILKVSNFSFPAKVSANLHFFLKISLMFKMLKLEVLIRSIWVYTMVWYGNVKKTITDKRVKAISAIFIAIKL